MIKIYTSPSCSSCRKVKKWFEEEGIPYIEKNIFVATIREEDVKEMLSKSENGTEDIISKKSKIVKESGVDVDSMTINELISFISKNPSVLKRPIIVDDHRIQVGYNPEEIRRILTIRYAITTQGYSNTKSIQISSNITKTIKK